MLRTLLPLLAVSALLTTACKKNNANKTTCTSTINGYLFDPYTYAPAFAYGSVNLGSGTLAPVTTQTYWMRDAFDDGAAYNTSNMCYYTFNHSASWLNIDTLVSINASGSMTHYTKVSGDNAFYRNVLYNPVSNKLYCLKNWHIAELSVSGSTYSGTIVASDSLSSINTEAVNTATGDIYFTTKTDTTTHEIRKYHPGGASSSVVTTITGTWNLLGMRFNKNDNMLYVLRDNYPASLFNRLVRIDPATGTAVTFPALSFEANVDVYSATVDPCSNRYILSYASYSSPTIDTGHIYQLDMSGAVVQHNFTSRPVMGLTAH